MGTPTGWNSNIEPLCGENDPYGREDTANKYTKTLWDNLTAEHQESDGAHLVEPMRYEIGSYTGNKKVRVITLDDPTLVIKSLMIGTPDIALNPVWMIADTEILDYPEQKLGINSDAADESTTFTDVYGVHTITGHGGVKYDDAVTQGWFDTAIYFDGTDDYLSVADHADWDIGTNSVVISFNVYFLDKAANTYACFLDHDDWRIWYEDGNTRITVTIEGTAYHWTWTPADDTWYSIQVERQNNAGAIYVWIDGVQIAPLDAVDASDITGSANDLTIGCDTAATAAYFFNGYLDDIYIGHGTELIYARCTPFVGRSAGGEGNGIDHFITRIGTGQFQLPPSNYTNHVSPNTYYYMALGE